MGVSPSTRSRLGLYLDNAQEPRQQVHISLFSPIWSFLAPETPPPFAKGLNTVGFAFDGVYTARL